MAFLVLPVSYRILYPFLRWTEGLFPWVICLSCKLCGSEFRSPDLTWCWMRQCTSDASIPAGLGGRHRRIPEAPDQLSWYIQWWAIEDTYCLEESERNGLAPKAIDIWVPAFINQHAFTHVTKPSHPHIPTPLNKQDIMESACIKSKALFKYDSKCSHSKGGFVFPSYWLSLFVSP